MKFNIGDIVRIIKPGAHMPWRRPSSMAHWHSGSIEYHEKNPHHKFEVIGIIKISYKEPNYKEPIEAYHIIIEDAIEKRKGGWTRTEFSIYDYGLELVKPANYLPSELFEI